MPCQRYGSQNVAAMLTTQSNRKLTLTRCLTADTSAIDICLPSYESYDHLQRQDIIV